MANIVGDDPYRIVAMTYNVCFGCMYSDFSDTDGKESGNSRFDATSRELVKLCSQKNTDQGKNICLTNIQSVFESTKLQFSSLDLVGLQEASNWEQLIKASVLTSLSYVHHKALSADMVSLYNHKKFKLDAFIVGNITSKTMRETLRDGHPAKDKPDGRPYQLLFLTHRKSTHKYVFINIHNSHLYTRKELVAALGHEKRFFVPKSNMQSFSNCNYDNVDVDTVVYKGVLYDIGTYYLETTQRTFYEIIFMGDTNDQGRIDLWKEEKEEAEDKQRRLYEYDSSYTLFFRPLLDLYIGNNNVSSKGKQPPNSCCSGRVHLRDDNATPNYIIDLQGEKGIAAIKHLDIVTDIDDKYGDYILISKGLQYEENKNNVIPDFKHNASEFPTSDHLPVVSVIILPQPQQQPQAGGNRRQRRKHKSARQLHTRNRHKHKQTKLKNTKTKRIYKK